MSVTTPPSKTTTTKKKQRFVTYCNKFILITLQDPSNDFPQKNQFTRKIL